MKHYSREEVRDLRQFIEPLINDGFGNDEIAAALNEAGKLTANGKNWLNRDVSYFVISRKIRKPLRVVRPYRKKRAQASATTTKVAAIDLVKSSRVGILNSNMTAETKINLLKVLEGVQ